MSRMLVPSLPSHPSGHAFHLLSGSASPCVLHCPRVDSLRLCPSVHLHLYLMASKHLKLNGCWTQPVFPLSMVILLFQGAVSNTLLLSDIVKCSMLPSPRTLPSTCPHHGILVSALEAAEQRCQAGTLVCFALQSGDCPTTLWTAHRCQGEDWLRN